MYCEKLRNSFDTEKKYFICLFIIKFLSFNLLMNFCNKFLVLHIEFTVKI